MEFVRKLKSSGLKALKCFTVYKRMIISEDDPSSKPRAITGNIRLQHFNAIRASKQTNNWIAKQVLKL
jgi:flavoprotein